MKYTNYIINGKPVDIEQIISNKKVLREISILAALPVAITGLAIFASIIPLTVVIDGARALKYEYYQLQKKYKRYRYYENVFTSLSIDVDTRVRMYLALHDISHYDKRLKMNYQLSPRFIFLKGLNNIKQVQQKLTIF
jgi:hypothetical protein